MSDTITARARGRAARTLGAALTALGLLTAACGPSSQPAPTSGQPAPTTAPAKPAEAAKPAATTPAAATPAAATTAPAVAPTVAPTVAAPKPTEAAKPGAGATTAPAVAGAGGGVIRASQAALPKILHWYPESQNNSTIGNDALSLMSASLISIDYEKIDWVVNQDYDAAKEMPKISSDGKTMTFLLRDDLKWSDGRPLTSADFQFAWDNASKKENNWVGYGTVVPRVAAFKTPDPKTVECTLNEVYAKWIAYTTCASISPVPKHVWEGKPWLDPAGNPEVLKPSVVSGPYIVSELTAEKVTFARNPNWWGKKPNLDGMTWTLVAPNNAIETLRTQQADWVPGYPAASHAEAKKIPTVQVFEWTGASGSYRSLEFNTTRPNLKEKPFRAALAHSINRADLVDFEEGLASPQFGLYTEGSKWRSDNVEKYPFDLNRAKALLQGAGYRLSGQTLMDPQGQPVKLEILWPSSSPARGKMATYAQQQWKQLGIETTVTQLEFNAFIDKYNRQKDFDIAMGSWQATLDAAGPKSQFETGGTQNSYGYSNPRVDELFKQGDKEQDDTKRKAIYDEIQKLIADDLPVMSLVTLQSYSAMDKKVQNVKPSKGGDLLRQNTGGGAFFNWTLAR